MRAMIERALSGHFTGAEGTSGRESTHCERELVYMGQSR